MTREEFYHNFSGVSKRELIDILYNVHNKVDEMETKCDNLLCDIKRLRGDNAEDSISCDNLNRSVLYVSQEVYRRIKNSTDEIIVEAQCQPMIVLKIAGVGK